MTSSGIAGSAGIPASGVTVSTSGRPRCPDEPNMSQGTASPEDVDCLAAWNASLGEDLTNLITTLSFQDLSGQRIKKVVSALNQIEAMVVELYVSTGLILDAAEKDPSKNVQELQDEARQAVKEFNQGRSELKGPDKAGASQGAIDDMLSQLGL